MILTITLNPALDKSVSVQKLIPDKKLRCEEITVEAGGGGINVSKAIKELGGESMALFPSGGANGKQLEQLLIKEGIAIKVIPIAGETRAGFAATDLSTDSQYRFVAPGPVLSNEIVDACLKEIEDCKPVPDTIVFSGSLPPGISHNVAAKFAAVSNRIGARFIADTSGDTLKQAVHEGVYLLKPNLSELCLLVDKESLELFEVENAAKSIIDKGNAQVIVVSMGPSGALLLTKDICKRIPSPNVKKVSTIGAGDSMVAGMALMLSQGKPILEVVQFGVACGTAAIMTEGSQLFKKEDVLKLFEWIKLHC
jgi:6-phosphofructokinase 2